MAKSFVSRVTVLGIPDDFEIQLWAAFGAKLRRVTRLGATSTANPHDHNLSYQSHRPYSNRT